MARENVRIISADKNVRLGQRAGTSKCQAERKRERERERERRNKTNEYFIA